LVYSFKNNVVRDNTTNIINGPLAVLTFD